MNFKLLSSVALIGCSLTASAATIVNHSSHADPGVINKEQILYWLEKRGELANNASVAEKQLALNSYLGNKSFTPKKLPGDFGRKFLLEQQKGFENNVKHDRKLLNKSSAQANFVETEAKILVVMVDFSDHEANASTYPVSHYSDLVFSDPDSNGEIKTAYQYYQQESGGTMKLTGNAFGWVRAENEAAHYGGNDDDGDDKEVPALVLEAVTKAVAEQNVNLDDYDLDDDGIIDHVMIFHSSIGEEAGGGTLGEDAIWSHRFFVFDEQNRPVDVPGSTKKLYGYTISPLDARVGVVAHEFGHDLGVPDEYDTGSGTYGSPVADWSIMASGSWVDGGTHPSGFSPYAKDYFQNQYGGNWINQQELNIENIESQEIALVAATNHSDGVINQVKVNIPSELLPFDAPYSGDYQFYSTEGHLLNYDMSFMVNLPEGASELTMKARWDIEVDYDYAQVLVNGVVIAGNHTKVNNEFHDVTNFITDKSKNIAGAEGDLGWVDLTFDLTAYANQNITIKIAYITDPAASGYGLVVDNIKVTNNSTNVFSHGGESADGITLNGFDRIGSTKNGPDKSYYMQLRDHTKADTYLAEEGYDPGVVVWYRNDGVANNKVNDHPGEVFIGVVDADQNAIKIGNNIRGTSRQLRDAAFSRFDQTTVSGDSHLSAINQFNDKLDYSSPFQPESGIKLPRHGLTMEVTDQASDSSTASIALVKVDTATVVPAHNGLSVVFSVDDDKAASDSTYTWQMGDNTELTGTSVNHSYATAGNFTVTVTYQTANGSKTLSYDITVGAAITGDISTIVTDKIVSFTPNLTGGEGEFSYRWDFGDNNSSSNSHPSNTYENYGNYTVTLTVVDQTNQAFTFNHQVKVESVLTTGFSQTKSFLKVNFTSTTTGGDESYTYAWDFGDGSTSELKDPSHTYSTAGSYTVKLTATDGTGGSVESSANVTVTAQVITQPTTTKSSGGGSFGLLLISMLGIRFYRKK